MITSYEAFQKRVKIGDNLFIVPIEVLKELERLDAENEELKAENIQLTAQKSADDYEVSTRIICNLQSDRMGTSKVLVKTGFGILDDFWAELEGRIINALNGNDENGNKMSADRLPKIFGAGAEEFIRTRRANQMLNRKGIEVSSFADEPSDPGERRKKRAEVTRIE